MDWQLFLNWIACLYFAYFMIISILILLPTVMGISLGLKDIYIRALMIIFEFGRKLIDKRIHKSPSFPDRLPTQEHVSVQNTDPRPFSLVDICEFSQNAIEAIIDDEVTKRFSSEEIPSWNLLTRTNLNYHFISWRLSIIWLVGFFVRYGVLLPTRLFNVIVGYLVAVTTTLILQYFPSWLRKTCFRYCYIITMRLLLRGMSGLVTFHNRENRAKSGGICVANHTSPIDAIVLGSDRSYVVVGQLHGGPLGVLQRAASRCSDQIFFDRSESRDRLIVTNRLREHTEDSSKDPILIFPEGTCINNTSVMMFRKGCFEVGATIYPVAIKYDPVFCNAFWNSQKEPYINYMLNIMTSWATVCEVWYLPPMVKQGNESAIDFANRVKKEIALKGGLVELDWDGNLKRSFVPPSLKAQKQKEYADRLLY